MSTPAIVTIAILLAGAPALPAASQAQTDADEKALLAYRLDMATLRKVDEAHRTLVENMRQDPKYRALLEARRELEALQEQEEPTEAELRRMEALEREIEEFPADELSLSADAGETLADLEAQVRRVAPLAAAIRAAGLTPREYVLFQLALFQAMFAYGLQKAGELTELPPEVPAANVRFVELHEEEIGRLLGEWERLGRP